MIRVISSGCCSGGKGGSVGALCGKDGNAGLCGAGPTGLCLCTLFFFFFNFSLIGSSYPRLMRAVLLIISDYSSSRIGPNTRRLTALSSSVSVETRELRFDSNFLDSRSLDSESNRPSFLHI